VHGVEIELEIGGRLDGDGERDLAVLRIVHEALGNAIRHAGATHIAVHVSPSGVEVADDGVGFEPDSTELRSRHLGLTSMEERARELGGHLEIRSAPGTGTTVRLDVAP
jgi:signal transduction histidine kinase